MITSHEQRIRSLSVDRDELKCVLNKIQDRCRTAGENEARNYAPLGDFEKEEIESDRKAIREGFELVVTVKGGGGQLLNGSIENVFNSPDFPEEINSIFFDSAIPLQMNLDYSVKNKCMLLLDFSTPSVFDFRSLPSMETANGSRFFVQGSDATWVNGVFSEMNRYFVEHKSVATWIHRHSVYDLLLWCVGLPLCFWVCYRMSEHVTQLVGSGILYNAILVYLFAATLVAFRVLFHYARWIWPLIDYRQIRSKSARHKVFWLALTGGLGISLIYDVLKTLFSTGV